jgi:MoaA/NifB/PqqE/SkfB family radical SAM enzyme
MLSQGGRGLQLAKIKSRIGAIPVVRKSYDFLLPPGDDGVKLTPKRLLNLYRVRYEYERGETVVSGYPIILTVEAGNVCNLRCPACFTGAGEVGRVRSFMPLELYRRLLAELGEYLFRVDFYNWGEPLLAKDVYEMIAEAKRYGIGTNISTNFSIPFDAERAEKLVRSGLDVLGVSIDGATQENYEKYRVRGNLALVLENCRLVRDAKRRLGSKTPRMVWEYHVFPHNVHEIEMAKAMAAELEMEIGVDKGWVNGPEWDPDGDFKFYLEPKPARCDFLWQRAVVNNDGGVAPCCGTFYKEDDYGRLSVSAGDLGSTSFREVWNNETFQTARRFFRSRNGTEAERRLICFDCPSTKIWEGFQRHLAGGGDIRSFEIRYSTNDSWNYFLERKPEIRAAVEAGDLIELSVVERPGAGAD